MPPGSFWAQGLRREKLGSLWGSEEEIRTPSESQKSKRTPIFTEGGSGVLAWFQEKGVGVSLAI